MTYNPGIHHRNSVRLRSYDYRSAGAYFVTICTFQKEPILAEIVNGATHLKPPGEIVREEWFKSMQIRAEIELDEFIVMPNHLHGIVFIDDSVGAHGMRPESGGFEMRAHSRAPLHRAAKSLGSFIAGFKSACTKRINESRSTEVVLENSAGELSTIKIAVHREDDTMNAVSGGTMKILNYMDLTEIKWDICSIIDLKKSVKNGKPLVNIDLKNVQ